MRTFFVSATAVAIVLAVTSPALAQSHALDRGSYIIAGGASFTSSGIDIPGQSNDRRTSLALAPSVEYFVSPGLALGGRAALGWSDGPGGSFTSYGLGPSVRYFFISDAGRLHPYVGGNVSLQRLGSDDVWDSEWGYRAAVGGLGMLTSAVGLTGEIFYDARHDDDIRRDVFGFQMGVAAFVF